MAVTYESVCKTLGCDLMDIYKTMPPVSEMYEDSWESPVRKLSLEEIEFVIKGGYLDKIKLNY